ncbi:MAG: sensor domain-containing diguanylate cyclase [Spirochaetaceae bacterium]|nr:sensor domain-containing diguanylate cyclase [Spirochaetaceae bacterium]MBO7485773.1 sensor domain-containing diguanylate cyclase [Spirochaetaceae bacterium]
MDIEYLRKKTNAINTASYEKQIYDLKQLLEISKSLSTELNIHTIIDSILYICMCQMRTLSAGLFIQKDFDAPAFTLASNYNGMEIDESIDYSIPVSHPLLNLLERTNMTYSYEELIGILKEAADGLEVFEPLKPSLIVPLIAKRHINGILVLGERIDLGEGNIYSSYEKEQILNIASLAAIAINNAQLMDMATTDMMTKLKTKHYFFTILTDKIETSAKQEIPLSVLMFDIDFFKKFNDTYGHDCGDYVLKTVADTIKNGIRAQDLASRYGGEEFTVMLYNTDKDTAFKIAERIRKKIEGLKLKYNGNKVSLTISIGLSTFNSREPVSAKQLVVEADTALYESKRTGRNKTSCFSGS